MGRISIYVGSSRMDMGMKAASDAAGELRELLKKQSGVRMILAAAPSQAEMLASLGGQPGIDWSRVTAFHMDEYLGLAQNAPQLFGSWLRRVIFDKLPFGAVHLIEPGNDPESAAADYARMLEAAPIDIVCLGIGVNGHLAFNDPPADLNDQAAVKIVRLDAACRQQQVDDGCFSRIEEVPEHALTLTIPRLLAANHLFSCVPGASKRKAVSRMLHDAIGPDCPATALRLHPNCALYLDTESAPTDVSSGEKYF
jgi:glucosamine-6-phosphate deaminase